MRATSGRLTLTIRPFAVALGLALAIGQAQAQSIDCYDRALPMPSPVTLAMADACYGKISTENTTNDRHAIALYNAARFYVVLVAQESDSARKASLYDKVIASVVESRDRAADSNVAFSKPWKKGDRRSQDQQAAANRFFLANRSYLLGKAYFELGQLGGARSCAGRDNCFERAAAELEQDAVARPAGAFRDDYLYLRASVYQAWGQTAAARRDFEFLKDSPAFGAQAKQQLGEILLADAQRSLLPPLTLSGIAAARLSFKAATAFPNAMIAGQLGLAQTFMDEARLVSDPVDRRARYADARREFGLALTQVNAPGSDSRRRALEGRGTAALELGRLGDARAFAEAIGDLRVAASLDTTIAGAPAQLQLARALAETGEAAQADAAYAEAARRFGADPRAALARSEQAFQTGRRDYLAGQMTDARLHFRRALEEPSWREGRADAFFFLSAIDLRSGENAVSNADEAVAASAGGLVYRQQACLARIAAGGAEVRGGALLPACAGSDVLMGLLNLRQAQFAKRASDANDLRRQAQTDFMRARGSGETFRTSPVGEPLGAADLAAFGGAVALGCSSAAGLNVPVDLEDVRLERAKAFFVLHRVHSCIATD